MCLKPIDMHLSDSTNKQANKQTNKQTNKLIIIILANKQANKQTSKLHTNKQRHVGAAGGREAPGSGRAGGRA